jgi:N-acetylated-alpha-linked acidic dipeptidase
MADASLLPFEFSSLADAIQSYVDELVRDKNIASKVNLEMVKSEIERMRTAAAAFNKAAANAGPLGRPALTRVNQALVATERAWLVDAGLPGRSWYKHQLVAPGLYTGYSAKTIPGVREAAEASRWEEATAQVRVFAGAMRAVTDRIAEATRLVEGETR